MRRPPISKNDRIKGRSTSRRRSFAGQLYEDARGMNLSILVRHARRRAFQNALLAQGANAVSVALGAFILLLLVGTQILEWQVALFLPPAAPRVGGCPPPKG